MDDVKAIILQAKDGQVVRIADVAEVGLGGLTLMAQSPKWAGRSGTRAGARLARCQCAVGGCWRQSALGEIARKHPGASPSEAFYDRSNLVERAVGVSNRQKLARSGCARRLLLPFSATYGRRLSSSVMLPLGTRHFPVDARRSGLSAP